MCMVKLWLIEIKEEFLSKCILRSSYGSSIIYNINMILYTYIYTYIVLCMYVCMYECVSVCVCSCDSYYIIKY